MVIGDWDCDSKVLLDVTPQGELYIVPEHVVYSTSCPQESWIDKTIKTLIRYVAGDVVFLLRTKIVQVRGNLILREIQSSLGGEYEKSCNI